MGEHLRSDIPSRSLALDRESKERSGRELTRFNSESYFSITFARSKDFPSHHCLDTMQAYWTDEKHGLYLDSLEASFVKELHQHRRLPALSSQQKMRPRQTMSNISSSQFMVLQDACWQKAKFERNDPFLDSTADSPANLEDLWINHFASAGKQCTLETPDLLDECGDYSDGRHFRNMSGSFKFTRSSQQFPTCGHDSVAFIKEVSDQNFVDNHQGALSSGVSTTKRLKKRTLESSSNDQIVPLGRLSSEREKQKSKFSSEHLENSQPPNSGLCYSLRGS